VQDGAAWGAGPMATKPTRLQQQACDDCAEALVLVTRAARLDGGGRLGRHDLEAIAGGIACASSAFGFDEIVARALTRRASGLGLPSSTADLLTLLDAGVRPLEMLLLPDDEFKAVVARLEEELGDV
jgi:hypothetical protein